MTVDEAAQRLKTSLLPIYDVREAANITDWVMEHLTGLRKIDRIVQRNALLTEQQQAIWTQHLKALLAKQPVQYVLKEAWFCGMRLFVDQHVLIPRPETEELVEWIVQDRTGDSAAVIADIGTGSGCIAVAIGKFIPGIPLYAVDISDGALEVAKKNASAHRVPVHAIQMNVLDEANWHLLPAIDVLVSNPPYIARHELAFMTAQVVDHEPHAALFVDDNDPLIFYRALARLGKRHLTANGQVYVETHADRAVQTADIFRKAGYLKVEIRKDIHGKDRMVKASLTNY